MAELQDIDGLGNTAEEQLNDLGIHSINQLANADLEELEEAGVYNAEKILERSQKQGVLIDSGTDVEQEERDATYISTGMQAMDRILGGGLQGGYLIGLAGESKVGKTQLAFQLLATAADLTDGAAVYIETEPNRFSIERVKTLCKKEDSYKQIYRIEAHNADSDTDNLKLQLNAYEAIKENFDNVSVVVVDSFVANFRLSGEFSSRADLPDRNTEIAEHLKSLQSLSNHFDCPTILTLQVMGNPDQFSSGDVEVWGSILMDHTITYLLFLSHAKGELKEAEMIGHPHKPDKSVTLKIPEDSPIEAMD